MTRIPSLQESLKEIIKEKAANEIFVNFADAFSLSIRLPAQEDYLTEWISLKKQKKQKKNKTKNKKNKQTQIQR